MITSTTSVAGVETSPGLLPTSSIESHGSFTNWNYGALGDSMFKPDPAILHGLGLHPLQSSGLASWATDHGIGHSFDASSSHSRTPALTISPFTSSMSDFGSFGGETNKLLSPNIPSKDDREPEGAKTSSTKRKQVLKTKSSAVKRYLKRGFDGDKTPASHPVECGECGMRFRQPGELRKHEKTKHISVEQRPRACSLCDKRFIWPKDVKRHEERVHKKAFTGIGHHSVNDSFDHGPIGDVQREDDPDLEMPDGPFADFQLFFEDDDYDGSFDLTTQQDWLCANNNPHHNTFSRTHSPGEGSAPHRGARV